MDHAEVLGEEPIKDESKCSVAHGTTEQTSKDVEESDDIKPNLLVSFHLGLVSKVQDILKDGIQL